MRIHSLLLCCIVLICAEKAVAQTDNFFTSDEEHRFFGGLTAGVNFTQVDGDGFGGYNKLGWNAGPVVYTRFSDKFGASLGISFSQKGCNVHNTTESVYVSTTIESYSIKLNYVEIPVMAYTFSHKLQFGAGASYGRLLSAKEEAFTIAPVNLDPGLYPFKKTEISLIALVGYQFYNHWFITGSYIYSLLSVRDVRYIPVAYSRGNTDERNNVISIRLLYLF